jgi:hypothetical protein
VCSIACFFSPQFPLCPPSPPNPSPASPPTRLDVCSPKTSDDDCRFTIISPWEDHDLVGELTKYRDMEVQVRGIVQPMHGRAGMVLSHARQFHGGPPRFKPSPMLARGFNAEESRPPIRDPNLRAQGSARAFMNTRDQEPMPRK